MQNFWFFGWTLAAVSFWGSSGFALDQSCSNIVGGVHIDTSGIVTNRKQADCPNAVGALKNIVCMQESTLPLVNGTKFNYHWSTGDYNYNHKSYTYNVSIEGGYATNIMVQMYTRYFVHRKWIYDLGRDSAGNCKVNQISSDDGKLKRVYYDSKLCESLSKPFRALMNKSEKEPSDGALKEMDAILTTFKKGPDTLIDSCNSGDCPAPLSSDENSYVSINAKSPSQRSALQFAIVCNNVNQNMGEAPIRDVVAPDKAGAGSGSY